jgi:diguanylate cyclase (GGDEF)-like protein/PAS domain S-box-containing protein
MSERPALDIRGQTILIVDDIPANLGLVVDHLEGHGLEVAIARDGKEALDRAQFIHPDLILLDVMMPGIDGFETCRRLKAAEALRDIPVIFMTALTDSGDKVRAFTAGGVDYVTKPFQAEEVLARVKTHLTLRATQQQLAARNLHLDAALNNMVQGLVMFDSSPRIVVSNRRYLEMYNLSPEVVKPGCTLHELIVHRKQVGLLASAPEEYCRQILESVASGKTTAQTIESTDGRFIHVVNQPISGGGWVVTHEDITERKRAEGELHSTREFLNTVIENVPVPIVVKTSGDLKYALINRAGEELYGVPREAIIGKTVHDVFPRESADIVAQQDAKLMARGDQQDFGEHSIETPGNGRRIVTTKRLSIFDAKGQPQYLLGVVEDITDRKKAEQQIEHLAHHDALTDLPNRAAFREYFRSTFGQTKDAPFALMCIDLDRFKEVNDVFGHSVGDALLCEISRRLLAVAGDAFVGRLGGDEFVVVARDGTQPEAAAALAERMLAAVAEDFTLEGQQLRSGLSIGVAIYPTDGADATTLLGNADAALYRAKADGRGTIRFFQTDMDKKLRERRTMQHDLRAALARSELTLYYQPQALIDGEITGFEALLRWKNPARGMVSPGTFIPIAEESGLIVPIGEWVLRESCREAASWAKPLQVAVNLSPIQFRHGDLPSLVHSILLETGLAANRLELEVTEGVLIGDFSRAISILRRLKALGVHIAMDDFGTGYSSLSYLQSFPFDKIKIDQSFISRLDSSMQSAAIVRAVLALGRGLALPVIAEGVETKAQLDFLASELCPEIQGFLIGKPLPISEYAAIIGRETVMLGKMAYTG